MSAEIKCIERRLGKGLYLYHCRSAEESDGFPEKELSELPITLGLSELYTVHCVSEERCIKTQYITDREIVLLYREHSTMSSERVEVIYDGIIVDREEGYTEITIFRPASSLDYVRELHHSNTEIGPYPEGMDFEILNLYTESVWF